MRYLSSISLAVVVLMALACAATPTPVPTPSPTPGPNLTDGEVIGLVTQHLQEKRREVSEARQLFMAFNPEYASALRVTENCWGLLEDDSLSAVYDRTKYLWTVKATTEEGGIAGEWSVYDRTFTLLANEDNPKGC